MRLFTIIFLLLFSGCIVTDVLYGDSKVTTVTTTIPEFNGELTVDFPVQVTIDSGAAQVTITTDENLQEYYSVDTTNGNIAVHRTSTYKLASTEERIAITLPHLNKITLTNAVIIDTVHDSVQEITLNGSAHYTGTITRKELSVHANGSSALLLSGDLRDVSIIHNSSETIDLSKLYTLNASVLLTGTGSLICAPEAEIRGTLQNTGSLILTTFPPMVAVDQKGSGSIVYRTASPAN